MCNSRLLEGKVAVVTGAGRGIGRAVTELFLQKGAIVYAVEREEGALDDLSDCDRVKVVYMDITNSGQVKDLFLSIKQEQSCLDILVNNAGIMQDAVIGMITNEQIKNTYAVNVFAIIDMIQYAVKFFRRQKSGSIINMSSIMGINGDANKMLYCSSKGAVIAMTKAAAKELAPQGIRVNAVAPGTVDTTLLSKVTKLQMDATLSSIKMGRLARPEEIAQAILFLASDNSSYITGQIIGVDGSMIV